MKKHNDTEMEEEPNTLADDARALLTATADVAGEKVADARQRLSEGVERAKEACARAKDAAAEGIEGGEKFVRAHPYASLGIALGIGALIGLLMRRSRED